MRARNIKPGLWKDEDLAELPIEARYLFPGLWCLADCMGRLEDRPRLIKSEIYPFDDAISAAKVHTLLQALHDGGFICRYEAGEKKCIQVVNFEKHQNPHKQEREKGSQIPEPPIVEPHQKKTEVVPLKTEANQNCAESNGMIPDSGFLIPDPLIPDSGKRIPAHQSKRVIPMREQPGDFCEIDDWFEERISRHPKRGKNLMLAKTMISQIAEVADPAWRAEFTRVHELWIASPSWTGKNLHFAPSMDQWIADKGWKYEPPAVESDTEKAWASL